ncbi:MAG TPA: hypothetical protein DCL15_15255 [Chloroflexi bacterium]|nr:hypothetical protein [Chloroflexota bacterium]HHW86130.1 DNRLRE domain-containing protein [Chloroflexota bacterium]
MSTHSQHLFLAAEQCKASTQLARSLHRSAAGQTRLLCIVLMLCISLALMTSALPARAAPAAPLAVTVELLAVEDAGAVQSVPTFTGGGTPYFVLNSRPGGSFDHNLVLFDLAAIPADAVINSALLRLHVNASANPLDIELGRVEGVWDEGTLTWNNKPAITWGGAPFTQNAPAVGDVDWVITAQVQAWLAGAQPNYGIALRGVTTGTGGVRADTREGAIAPRLVVTYTLPAEEGPRPDLGDAPDSSNHHGVSNTAYLAGTVPGNFPTVWDVPTGQVAGPRHANQTLEGWLGEALSREVEADQGPDQDGPNNILRNASGVIGDVADKDRGDDGWRNRQVKFFDCQRTTLEVRISKAAAATRNFMYLNVWLDGNRDGDWADIHPCQATETEPAQAGYEWIVQNYVVDMTAITAGGSRDFLINTEKLLNTAEGLPHWMRFTLSEAPAVQPPFTGDGPGLPDGRGPHPADAPSGYQFGETEDIYQKPAPAGEDGTLQLQKRVITTVEPTEWIDYVTYEIRLKHIGGSQPVQAQIRDELPYPLIVYPTILNGNIEYVRVESPTNGAMPLQAALDVRPPQGGNPPQQIVKWAGAIAPDAEVVLTFQVRVLALCAANQQTMTFTNTAQARKQGDGAILTATDDFTAKCINYDENHLDFEPEPITDAVDLDELTHATVRYTITNSHPFTVALGVFQLPPTGAVTGATASAPRFLGRVTLPPNAVTPAAFELNLAQDAGLTLADDLHNEARLSFCMLPDANDVCPDAQLYPQLHGELPPIPLPLRTNDLGDAPDSSNHAGVAMAAFGGVAARYPTVFDPTTGLPEGPLHRAPRPFHLGKRVSLEAEADLGPDQDPLNNIVPLAADPDNDRADDGTNLALWNLSGCAMTNLPVQVFISPAAVVYFQQLGTPGYINIWLDSNRDGDWEDATQCAGQPAVEHIVIDAPVNVVGLGAGLHTLNVPTGLIPPPITDQSMWVRITLSERPSNKTLTAGALSYGDGRGYPQPFRTGETEDYLYWPAGAAGAGPDLEVALSARTERSVAQVGLVQGATVDQLGNFEIQLFKIEYSNRGATTAQNALLEFQIPQQLRGAELAMLQAPSIRSESISFNFDKLQFTLDPLAPGQGGAIVLGWYGCITCTVSAAGAALDSPATVTAQMSGDVDTSNNQSSAVARGLLSSPIIGAFMDYTDDAVMDRVITGRAATCRAEQTLHGRAEPNRIIAILIGLQQVATVTSDANGDFSYTVTLPNGLHRVSARYAQPGVNAAQVEIVSPRDVASGQATGILVDTSLPYDPMSVTFTDSQGRTIAMPTLGYSFGATQTGAFLRSGETYTVGVDSCGGALNQFYKITSEEILISSLTDPDGDGRYTGSFTYNPGVTTANADAIAELQLVTGAGATQQRYGVSVQPLPTAVVRSQTTMQPLASAVVTALAAQLADGAQRIYELVAPAVLGQPNPTATGADGSYSFVAPAGAYRLNVVQNGYQPYRTADIDVATGALAMDVALAPLVADAATHTVYMTASGFEPATLVVPPGSVVEFVNLDLTEHGARHPSAWDSGLLATGERFKVRLDTAGTFVYADVADALNQGGIVIANETPVARSLYLPVVTR